MFKKTKLGLTSILLFALAISNVLSIVTTNESRAATLTLEEVNSKYYAGHVLDECFKQKLSKDPSSLKKISYSEVNSYGNILGAYSGLFNLVKTSTAIGQYYAPDSGIAECTDAATIQKALGIMGYSDGADFFIKNGYSESLERNPLGSNVLYYVSSNPSDSNLLSRIPTQIDAAKYTAWKKVFDSNCGTISTNINSSGSDPYEYYQVSQDSSGKYTYTVTKAIFPTDPKLPGVGHLAFKNVYKWDFNAGDISCKDLLAKINGVTAAYVNYMNSSAAAAANDKGYKDPTQIDTATTKSSCQISGGLGWIVCPVVNFLANIADNAYGILLKNNLLSINSNNLLANEGPAYQGWIAIRNIANVLFMIAFLAVILSQLTGFGISNYGIKKMLPRIIISVILVNLSFWLCVIAIELFNILAVSLKSIFDSMSVGIKFPDTGAGEGNIWGGIVVTILGSAIVWANLAALIPMLIAGVIAIATIVLILGARQAIVLILVVLSPLAFVAFLLPNTEGLYKKWLKLFVNMLVLFPTVAVIFGGAAFASKLLFGSASTSGDSKILLQIIAAGVMVTPLFFVPTVLKKSIDAAGNLGTKLSGAGSKAGGWAGKQATSENNLLGQALKQKDRRSAINRAQTQGGSYRGWNPLRRVASFGNRNLTNRLTGNIGRGRSSRGTSVANQQHEEDTKQEMIAQQSWSDADITSLATTGNLRNGQKASAAQHSAAIRKYLETKPTSQRMDLYRAINDGMSTEARREIKSGFFAKGDNAFLGGGFASHFDAGNFGGQNPEDVIRSSMINHIRDNGIKPESLPGIDAAGLAAILGNVSADAGALGSFQQSATEALGNADIRKSLTPPQAAVLTTIQNTTPPAPTP